VNKQKGKESLINLLCDINDKVEMQFFLNQILTKAEINDLIDRIRIYRALACMQLPQRECAKILNVSISKVTRGASNIHNHKHREYWRGKFNFPSEPS
jgi:TrpR family transcriptional regulator, trp operon repressor